MEIYNIFFLKYDLINNVFLLVIGIGINKTCFFYISSLPQHLIVNLNNNIIIHINVKIYNNILVESSKN